MTAGLSRQAGYRQEVSAMARKNQGSEERLAAALRENLKRRKAQARDLGKDDEQPKSGGRTSN